MLTTPGRASWRERRGGLGLTHCDDFAKFSSLHHANGLGTTFPTTLRRRVAVEQATLEIIACLIMSVLAEAECQY
jgi:hypothetical protein